MDEALRTLSALIGKEGRHVNSLKGQYMKDLPNNMLRTGRNRHY